MCHSAGEGGVVSGQFQDKTAIITGAASGIGRACARLLAARGASVEAADIDASPIVTFRELSQDPQAWANDYFLKTHCSEVDREGEIRGLPIGLSKTPGEVSTLGPELGQDTEIILLETLGLEWDRIAELKEKGAIP